MATQRGLFVPLEPCPRSLSVPGHVRITAQGTYRKAAQAARSSTILPGCSDPCILHWRIIMVSACGSLKEVQVPHDQAVAWQSSSTGRWTSWTTNPPTRHWKCWMFYLQDSYRWTEWSHILSFPSSIYRLQRRPRGVVINHFELLRDLDFRQMRIDWHSGQGPVCQILPTERLDHHRLILTYMAMISPWYSHFMWFYCLLPSGYD